MCTVNNSIFREYDIRGIADEDLTDEVVEMIGLAFGSTIIDHGLEKISIGRDCRKSSNRIFDALSKGIIKTGVNVVNVVNECSQCTLFWHEMVANPSKFYASKCKKIQNSHSNDDTSFKCKCMDAGDPRDAEPKQVDSGQLLPPGGLSEFYYYAIRIPLSPPTLASEHTPLYSHR